MPTFEVVADNGTKPEVDEVFTEHAVAYKAATSLSHSYLYVALYKNCRLIEEFGPNEEVGAYLQR